MRKFNITGLCNPKMHYMVDISNKIQKILKLIYDGDYFTINRARQFGKTTTMSALERILKDKYIVFKISFEGIGEDFFKNEENFSSRLFNLLSTSVKYTNKELAENLIEIGNGLRTIEGVSEAISDLCISSDKKIVLMIDEVDKTCNNQLFLTFLGILRNKYLDRK